METITKAWIPAYHGTKFKYLESIIEYGLKIHERKLPNGTVTPKLINIPIKDRVSGLKNWYSIFGTASINYDLNDRYSEIFDNIDD